MITSCHVDEFDSTSKIIENTLGYIILILHDHGVFQKPQKNRNFWPPRLWLFGVCMRIPKQSCGELLNCGVRCLNLLKGCTCFAYVPFYSFCLLGVFFWWLINKWLVTLRRSYDFGMFPQRGKPPRQGIALACFSRCVVSLSPAVLISVGLFWGTNIQTIKFGGQSLHPPQEAGDAASLILSGSKGGHEEFRDWSLQKMKASTS